MKIFKYILEPFFCQTSKNHNQIYKQDNIVANMRGEQSDYIERNCAMAMNFRILLSQSLLRENVSVP